MPLTDLLSISSERAEAAQRVAERLRNARRVAVTTHINADGDACGSAAALVRLLPQMGIDAHVVNPTPWPSIFNYLLGPDVSDRSSQGSKALRDIDALLVLDVSDMSRLGHLAETARKLTVPRIVIDHHAPSDEPAGELLMDDPAACATGELLFDFATALDLEITPPIAEALYTAILTDTGGFRYANTTPRWATRGRRVVAG